jgi:hypothetical protein
MTPDKVVLRPGGSTRVRVRSPKPIDVCCLYFTNDGAYLSVAIVSGSFPFGTSETELFITAKAHGTAPVLYHNTNFARGGGSLGYLGSVVVSSDPVLIPPRRRAVRR